MVYAKRLISVPVRLLEALRQCRRASASIKMWAARRLISVPVRVSSLAEHSGTQRNPAQTSANQPVLKSRRSPKLFILQGI